MDSVPAATLVRQPTPADEEAFVAAVRGSRDLHEPWIEPPDTAVRYAQYLDRISKPEYAGFLVIDMADGGLMRDGLAQVIGIAFGVLGLHRLEANIQPSNKPSISLVTRLGFRHEGFSPQYLMVAGAWRDHERFALTAEDWASRPQRTDPSDWRQ